MKQFQVGRINEQMRAMSFDELRALPNGPIKKFYLVKNFAAELHAATDRDLRTLGCDELCALLTRSRARAL